jgi:archaellum component FlaC
MEDIAKILANYGFPIAITMFLLIRMEKTITELRTSVMELKDTIEDLREKNIALTEKINILQEKFISLLERRRK